MPAKSRYPDESKEEFAKRMAKKGKKRGNKMKKNPFKKAVKY